MPGSAKLAQASLILKESKADYIGAALCIGRVVSHGGYSPGVF